MHKYVYANHIGMVENRLTLGAIGVEKSDCRGPCRSVVPRRVMTQRERTRPRGFYDQYAVVGLVDFYPLVPSLADCRLFSESTRYSSVYLGV